MMFFILPVIGVIEHLFPGSLGTALESLYQNAGRFCFSIKNHGVKAVYPTFFGTPKYLECKYEDISYAYIAKAGKHSALKIGTPEGEHKISGLNVLDEQYINSQINSAVSTPDDE